jgi:cation transport ATPase
MTQSIVRYLVLSLMSYLVGHKVITQEIADASTAAWVNYGIIIATVAGMAIWSFLEKRYKGVLSAYFPASTLSRTPAPVKTLLALAAGLACALFVSLS